MSIPSRGCLTLAFGSKYVRLARALATSIRIHNPDTPIAIATDSSDPSLAQYFDHIVPVRPEFGMGYSQKVHLDFYTPFEETLFIDADALVVGSLAPVWERFAQVPFGVVGENVNKGYWLTDIPTLLQRLSRPSIPRFNGGIYYFNRTSAAIAVFETARSVMHNYEQWNLDPVGNWPADEGAFAIAMATHRLSALDDDGKIMRSTLGIWGPLDIDVLLGHCKFYKASEKREVEPVIAHLLWPIYECYIYKRECAKLALFRRIGRRWISTLTISALMNPLYTLYSGLFRSYLRIRLGRIPVLPLPLWSIGPPPNGWVPEHLGHAPALAITRRLNGNFKRIRDRLLRRSLSE